MQFQDVIGQYDVKQQLVKMVQQNRLSHALLFLGREGSGALPLAMAFAHYVSSLPVADKVAEPSLFGEAPAVATRYPATPAEADAWMQQQPSFSKASQLVHPDIHFSYPVVPRKGGDKPVSIDYAGEWREFIQAYPYGNVYDWLQFIEAENKQGNITAQECNDIIHKLSLKSFESGYKLLVMWMPEYLGKEGNKLLKLIEEPPANTLFILVTENEEQLLSTIRSRCQLVKVPALDTADIETALVNRCHTTAEQARSIAVISEGNYREALHLLQHADEDFHALLRDWLNATLKYLPQAQIKSIEEIARLGREKQKQFLRYFNHLLEDAIRLQVLTGAYREQELQTITPREQDFAQRLNNMATLEQQQAIIEEIDKAAYYIERNANAKMLFHALTIKIFHIVRNNMTISV